MWEGHILPASRLCAFTAGAELTTQVDVITFRLHRENEEVLLRSVTGNVSSVVIV